MDDIFVALGTTPPIEEEEEKRHSTYTDALVEQLTAPHTEATGDSRLRRVSAPEGRSPLMKKGSNSLDQVREGGPSENVKSLLSLV